MLDAVNHPPALGLRRRRPSLRVALAVLGALVLVAAAAIGFLVYVDRDRPGPISAGSPLSWPRISAGGSELRSLIDTLPHRRPELDAADAQALATAYQTFVQGMSRGGNEAELVSELARFVGFGASALPYLTRIRDRAVAEADRGKLPAGPLIVYHSREAISAILAKVQVDYSRSNFIGKPNRLLNMRLADFARVDLSESMFQSASLFGADFRGATLRATEFADVDLRHADFSGADLTGVTFFSRSSDAGSPTDLEAADFRHALLDGVRFVSVRNLGRARFTLDALLRVDELPFAAIAGTKTYFRLLAPHRADLVARQAESPARVRVFVAKLDVAGFPALLERIEDALAETEPGS